MYYHKPIVISQTYCDIPKIDWKTQTNKFIQLSSVHSDWEKNHWNVDICKTKTSRCFKNNAHPKETMLGPAQPIVLEFLKKLTNNIRSQTYL